MKKAKNVFAIIAIVLGVVAAILAVGLPAIDAIAKGVAYDAAFQQVGPHVQKLSDNLKGLFDFGWFQDIPNHIPEFVTYGLSILGIILFIVLFVFMLCKKHAKGLGWFFPMLIIFLLSVAVVGANKFDNAGYVVTSYEEVAYIGYAATYVAIAAAALFIVASIFYIVYLAKASKKTKEINSAKEAALAKIESLLGGNN